jgi:hypothetical protein
METFLLIIISIAVFLFAIFLYGDSITNILDDLTNRKEKNN